jgi:hypothetical protein
MLFHTVKHPAMMMMSLGLLLMLSGSISAQSADDPQVATEAAAAVEGPANHVAGHVLLAGGPITFKRVVTYRLPQTTSSTTFVDLPNSANVIPIAPGRSALINARFHAETRCSEFDGVGEQNWCEVRIMIGGVEGYPQSSVGADSYAFDSTDDGTETTASWEGHALERHRCITNTGATVLVVPVTVQWKVTNFGGDAYLPNFWLDDFSFVAERSDGCAQAGS